MIDTSPSSIRVFLIETIDLFLIRPIFRLFKKKKRRRRRV